MSENIIYCYSSTGNCLDMAKNIARILGDTDIVMMRREPVLTDARGARRAGFIFSCCGGGLPGHVEEYVRQIRLSPEAYTFGVCQYSGYMGAGLHMIDQIVPLDYWKAVSHQCAYIPLFPHTVMVPPMTPKMAQRRSERKAGEIAVAVKLEKVSRKAPPRRIFNAAEYKIWPFIARRNAKKFKVHDTCVGCGLCESLCPDDNIRLRNGRPVWGNNCSQCVSCLQYCPKKAISMGKITDRRRSYHNPHIRAEELNETIIHID